METASLLSCNIITTDIILKYVWTLVHVIITAALTTTEEYWPSICSFILGELGSLNIDIYVF